MTDCLTTGRLPQEWVDITIAELTQRINNPSGVWADFNCLHRGWRIIKKNIVEGVIYCCEDLPDEPNSSDYPDLDSSSTIDECNIPLFVSLLPGYPFSEFCEGW